MRYQSTIAICATIFCCSCTERAPWGLQGTAGEACFPDNTCDPGLFCEFATCVVERSGSDAGVLSDAGTGCRTSAQIKLTFLPRVLSGMGKVVVRGKVDSSIETVRVGNAEHSEQVSVGANRFCAEFPLASGERERLAIVGLDSDGCTTDPIWIEVDGTLGVNMLAGRAPTAPWTTPIYALTDGVADTSVQLSFADAGDPPGVDICDNFTYIWFSLPDSTVIDRFEVRYPEGSEEAKRYAVCWSLMSSVVADLQPPIDIAGDLWRVIAQSTQGREDGLTVQLPDGGVRMRQLALLLFEDAQSGSTELFEIGEMAAWMPPSDSDLIGCH